MNGEAGSGLAVSPTELIGKYKGSTKEGNIYRHLEITFDFLHQKDLGFICRVTVSAHHCCSAKELIFITPLITLVQILTISGSSDKHVRQYNKLAVLSWNSVPIA